jgi:two-component system phosphate regulon sensor histidine kinase PhoR
MKNTNPSYIALNSALLITFFSIVSVVILSFVVTEFSWLLFGVLTLCQFGITFWILHYSIHKFIYEKIRIIYKNIHNFKVDKGSFEASHLSDKELLLHVDKEVEDWAKDKKEEIDSLKRLEQFRREFLGNVSHELKTPITNIQGYILTLLDGGLEDSDINRKYLLRTEKNIKRMIEIVDDLEQISKLEAGEIVLKPIRFDVVDLTRDVLEILEDKATEAGIDIVFGADYLTPIFVEADKESIRKVLSNLIENSLKYGKSEHGRTKISFFDMDELLLIEVTDNGVGIEEQFIPRLFERFFRIDKARSRDTGGSGLGLAIVKHILEAHKQRINVRSTVGIGSTFAFTLKKA